MRPRGRTAEGPPAPLAQGERPPRTDAASVARRSPRPPPDPQPRRSHDTTTGSGRPSIVSRTLPEGVSPGSKTSVPRRWCPPGGSPSQEAPSHTLPPTSSRALACADGRRGQPPETTTGDRDGHRVRPQAEHHERHPMVVQEGGGGGGPDEGRQVRDVVGAAGDHPDGGGARPRSPGPRRDPVHPPAAMELREQPDLDAEARHDRHEQVPVGADLVDEVFERPGGGPDHRGVQEAEGGGAQPTDPEAPPGRARPTHATHARPEGGEPPREASDQCDPTSVPLPRAGHVPRLPAFHEQPGRRA